MEMFESPETIGRMETAAAAFLASLRPEQRTKAVMPFDGEERKNWDFIPKPFRAGLPLIEMDSAQQQLAHRLLIVGLSLEGYAKAVAIMGLDNILLEWIKAQKHQAPDRDMSGTWGQYRYYFSFFGEPARGRTWGWRIVGHHLSLNYTIVDGRYLTATPSLMGAQPSQIGPMRPLRRDEDLAFELLASMDEGQRRAAVIHDISPVDFVTRMVRRIGDEEMPGQSQAFYRINERDAEALKYIRNGPKGLPGTELNGKQWQMMLDLLLCYIDRVPEEVAGQYYRRLRNQGVHEYHFAWAGGQRLGTSHYYRIQGPDLLIEFENSPENGNHAHAVWRDPDNDFAADILSQHYVEEHLNGDGFERLRTSMAETAGETSTQA